LDAGLEEVGGLEEEGTGDAGAETCGEVEAWVVVLVDVSTR
jgi:hypothetical protein